jgi:hypothetical protein
VDVLAPANSSLTYPASTHAGLGGLDCPTALPVADIVALGTVPEPGRNGRHPHLGMPAGRSRRMLVTATSRSGERRSGRESCCGAPRRRPPRRRARLPLPRRRPRGDVRLPTGRLVTPRSGGERPIRRFSTRQPASDKNVVTKIVTTSQGRLWFRFPKSWYSVPNLGAAFLGPPIRSSALRRQRQGAAAARHYRP